MHVQTYVLRQWGRTRALRTCVGICMYHSQSESVTLICMSYKAPFLCVVSKPFINSTYHSSCLCNDFLSADLEQHKCCCCSLLGGLLTALNCLDSVFTQHFPYWLQLLLIFFREKILRKVCYWLCLCRSDRPSEWLPSLCLQESI